MSFTGHHSGSFLHHIFRSLFMIHYNIGPVAGSRFSSVTPACFVHPEASPPEPAQTFPSELPESSAYVQDAYANISRTNMHNILFNIYICFHFEYNQHIYYRYSGILFIFWKTSMNIQNCYSYIQCHFEYYCLVLPELSLNLYLYCGLIQLTWYNMRCIIQL